VEHAFPGFWIGFDGSEGVKGFDLFAYLDEYFGEVGIDRTILAVLKDDHFSEGRNGSDGGDLTVKYGTDLLVWRGGDVDAVVDYVPAGGIFLFSKEAGDHPLVCGNGPG